MLEEMSTTHASNKTIGGHYASPDLGLPFHGYVAGGAEDDHEGTHLEDAVARVRQGMKAMLRYGSAWHDVASQVSAITELGLDSRHFMLCTDDSHAADDLAGRSHGSCPAPCHRAGTRPDDCHPDDDDQYRRAFWLEPGNGHDRPRSLGGCGACEDLKNFKADLVIAKGTGDRGEWQVEGESAEVHLSHLGDEVGQFEETSESGRFCQLSDESRATGQKSKRNVIGVIENQAPTRHLTLTCKLVDGEIKADMQRDIAKIALVERHKAPAA